MLMLLLRMVTFFQKAIFAWFIMLATSVLHCPVFSTAVPRYLYCMTSVSRCPFTIIPQCFSRFFSKIIVLVFLTFIAMPYCSQVASSLSIILDREVEIRFFQWQDIANEQANALNVCRPVSLQHPTRMSTHPCFIVSVLMLAEKQHVACIQI